MPTIKEIEEFFNCQIEVEICPHEMALNFLGMEAEDQCKFFNSLTDENSHHASGFRKDVEFMVSSRMLDADGVDAIALLHDAILAEKSKLRPKEPETKFKVGDVVYSFCTGSDSVVFKGVITSIEHKSSSGERWYKFKTEPRGDTLYTCDCWAYHSVDEALLESAKRAGY